MCGTNCKSVVRTALALVSCFLAARAVEACYTGLIIIPTADVTGPYTWALDLQWQGSSRAFKTDQLVINTELGWIGDRWQVFLGAQWPNAGGAPLVVLHMNLMGTFRHRSN